MNKKAAWLVGGVVGLMGLVQSASAANFASAAVKVTVNGSLSMVIVGSTVTTIPAVIPGASGVSGTAVVVKNDSVGMVETFSLKSFDSTPWTLQQAAGNNQFAMQAIFNTLAPVAADFTVPDDSLTTADKASSATVFSGTQSGAGVLPGGERSLWIKFDAPTVTTSMGSRDLTVSIVAGL